MKALVWHGKHDVRHETVEDPVIQHPRDAVVRVTSTAICGSDLHLYNGVIPTMQAGDVLGHEFMGEVVALGSEVRNLAVGDRVVVPFCIACGECWFCQRDLHSSCDRSNPNFEMTHKVYGHGVSALFGYSHMMGGFAGGQAEYVRVPFADVGPFKVPSTLRDEQVLFLTDIFPTGFMAADNCNIQPGDTVAVWGAGPVGLFAVKSAFALGAGRVVCIDHYAGRLKLAELAGAVAIDFDKEDALKRLEEMTDGRGPDSCIDAVGLEAHGTTLDALYDRVKTALLMATDRGHALRACIQACRKNGTVSIPGVYGGVMDKFPVGAIFGKGLAIKSGQTSVHRYLPRLLEMIESGQIDPTFLISHTLPLEKGPEGYAKFNNDKSEYTKIVLKTAAASGVSVA